MKRTLTHWIQVHRNDVLPTKEERHRVDTVARQLVDSCKDAVRDSHQEASVVLGGSYAHDTWLPGEGDIDAYLVFPKSVGREKLETVGLDVARRALRGRKIITRYAEHPYLESYIKGVRVNVVPCLASEAGQWLSAADRSLYHTEYVRRKLDENLRFHIRLLKKYLKTQELYGAEIRVKGFSGYVCEVLIINYGSLPVLFEKSTSWAPDTVISVETVPPEKEPKEFKILDPVDPTRNLARAISPRKLAEFVLLARLTLEGTTLDPFIEKLLKRTKIPSRYLDHVVLLSFKHSEKSEDILWGELTKSASRLARHLEADGFPVMNWSVDVVGEDCYIALLLESNRRSSLTLREGPYYYMKGGMIDFIEKPDAVGWWFDEGGRMKRLERTSLVDIREALKHYMSDPVTHTGFAKGLAKGASETWRVSVGKDIEKSGYKHAKSALQRLFGYAARLDSGS